MYSYTFSFVTQVVWTSQNECTDKEQTHTLSTGTDSHTVHRNRLTHCPLSLNCYLTSMSSPTVLWSSRLITRSNNESRKTFIKQPSYSLTAGLYSPYYTVVPSSNPLIHPGWFQCSQGSYKHVPIKASLVGWSVRAGHCVMKCSCTKTTVGFLQFCSINEVV